MSTNTKKIGYLSLISPSYMDITIQFGSNSSITIPGIATKCLTLIGVIAVAYHFRYVGRELTHLYKYIASRFNKLPKAINNVQYAVIYGASSKVGIIIGKYLARLKYNLILVDSPSRLETAKESIKSTELHAISIETIEYSPDDTDANGTYGKLVNQFEKYHCIRIFINCKSARIKKSSLKKIHSHTADEISMAISANVKGSLLVMKEALTNMEKKQGGSVINFLESIEDHDMCDTLYTATVSFVKAISYSLSINYKVDHIKFINAFYNQSNAKEDKYIYGILDNAFAYLGIKDEIAD